MLAYDVIYLILNKITLKYQIDKVIFNILYTKYSYNLFMTSRYYKLSQFCYEFNWR